MTMTLKTAGVMEYRGFEIRVRIEPADDWLTVTTDVISLVPASVHGAGGTQLISGVITPHVAQEAATIAAKAWIDAILSRESVPRRALA